MESTTAPTKRRKRSKYCEDIDKICDVCGDVAKSMHFGRMACDSCKAFFRRSVQRSSYNTFKCGAQKSCPVIKDNRRICQYCRFQKCIRIGMEVKWVMSEGERMNLWKSKLLKQRQKVNQPSSLAESRSPPADDAGNMPICHFPNTLLSPEDKAAIDHLIILQDLVFGSMPYPEECKGDTQVAMANLFFCICQKIRSFFSRLDDYLEIPKEDQTIMLRNGVGMSIYLHGAYNYDVENQTWPAAKIKDTLRLPAVSIETLKMFTVYPETYQTLMSFYNEYGQDLKDEVVLVLLCLITLFHDSEDEFTARAYIQNISNRYICLLRNYLQYKNGRIQGDQQLTRLLNSLFSVKKITNYHRVVNITPPSINSDQLISKGTLSLRDQIAAISFLLNQALISDIPKYASALFPEERVDLQLIRKNQHLTFRRPQVLPNPYTDLSFHHPRTNAVFGLDISTEKLLSFTHKNVLSFKSSLRKLQAISDANRHRSSSKVTKYSNSNSDDRNDRDVSLNQNLKYDHFDVINESFESCSPDMDYIQLQPESINHSCHSFIKH